MNDFSSPVTYRADFIIARCDATNTYHVFDNDMSDTSDNMHIAKSLDDAKVWIDGLCNT